MKIKIYIIMLECSLMYILIMCMPDKYLSFIIYENLSASRPGVSAPLKESIQNAKNRNTRKKNVVELPTGKPVNIETSPSNTTLFNEYYIIRRDAPRMEDVLRNAPGISVPGR